MGLRLGRRAIHSLRAWELLTGRGKKHLDDRKTFMDLPGALSRGDSLEIASTVLHAARLPKAERAARHFVRDAGPSAARREVVRAAAGALSIEVDQSLGMTGRPPEAPLRAASRLNGPAPKYVISNAAPRSDTFFMNDACSTHAAAGSAIAQKRCIASVTGTRKTTSSQAPILAR